MQRKPTAFIISLICISTLLAVMQLNLPRATAGPIPTPAPDVSYTWNVLASSGDVWWFNNAYGDEGHHAIETGGRITYNLTGKYPNDASWSIISGNVWYGNFSIYYANATLNWTKTNCSSTEVGSNLVLSVYSWQGSLIAPSNWSQNKIDMESQPADHFLYRDISDTIIIDYTYGGQITHMEYNKTTSVLTYAKTSAFGLSLEIQLAGLASLPVAALSVNESTLVEDFPVQFTDMSFAGVRPYVYSWDFGDGYSSPSQNPSHVYASPGSYNVNLTITDAASNTSSQILSIVVQADTLPTADFIMTGTPGVNKPLVFTSTSHGGNIGLTFTWNFGDGSPVSHLQNVTHTFNRTGSFTVTLTVRDVDGDEDTKTQVIVIQAEIPGADIVLVTTCVLLTAGITATIVSRKISRSKRQES
ncbi:MAG: PKD domain-containing protein [Candidatus Sigynarchaeota archaeon]